MEDGVEKGRKAERMMRSAFATIVYSYDEKAEKRINKDKRENRGTGRGGDMVSGIWLVFFVIDIARSPPIFLLSFLPSPTLFSFFLLCCIAYCV